MDTSDLPEESMTALSTAFGITEEKTLEITDIKAFLVTQISMLLDKNPSRLMSILYRIDVLEKHVKHAFETAPHGLLAATLADLVIDRQLLKQKYRRGGFGV
ncbi:MAG: hypothetical protein AB8G77_18610 [Rhodothermales bacterium]